MASRRSALIWLALCLGIFLVLFRPHQAFRSHWGGQDDECYRSWALKLTAHPPLTCRSESYLPGTAVLWIPAALVSPPLARLFDMPRESALAATTALTSFLCFVLGGWLLLCTFPLQRPALGTLEGTLFLLATPVVYYATSRTSLAHAGEFFLVAAFFHCLLRERWLGALGMALWLTATRLNDAPALFLLLAGVSRRRWRAHGKAWLRRPAVLAALCFAGLVTLLVVLDLLFVSGYNRVPLVWHLSRFRIERFSQVLWGSDWGLLWTAPTALWGALRVLSWKRLSPTARGAWVWLLCNLLLVFLWPSHGSDFGYRYLLGAQVAAWVLWRAPGDPPWLTTAGRALLGLSALWTTTLTFVYAVAEPLTPQRSWAGWNVPQFQLHALAALTHLDTYRAIFERSALGTAYAFFAQRRPAWGLPELPLANLPPGNHWINLMGVALSSLGLLLILRRLRQQDGPRG